MGRKGMSFQYAPFVVEAGKVKEFAQALGLKNALYEGRGSQELPVPPTFLTVIDYWNDHNMYEMLDQLGVDQTNVLHGEQSYTYQEAIHVGDELSGTVVVKEVTEKAGKVFYYLETNYVNQHDEVVAMSQSTLIDRK